MHSYPSRNDTRETKLYIVAERGEFCLDYLLYSSEIKRLEKQGFRILNVKPFTKHGLYSVTIDWCRAFGDAVPHTVFAYTHGIIETFPKASVDNFAKELYIIAEKASLIK